MKRILVVEDSQLVTKIVRHVVKLDQGLEAVYASSFAEAKDQLKHFDGQLFAALADLNLPDAPDGEVVDLMLAEGIPTIVLTGSYDEERREKILAKGIVDYVVKEGRYSYEYAIGVVHRLALVTRCAIYNHLLLASSAMPRRLHEEPRHWHRLRLRSWRVHALDPL